MKFSLLASLLLFCLYATHPAVVSGEQLKVLTINVWSGLDYIGTVKMGEYETAEVRKARFRSLVTQIRELSPDVIFVQEANPVGRYAAQLASALSLDEIHQVVNGGIKLGPVGIPANLKEGLVILAKSDLALKKTAAWKLSGSPGIHSDMLSFHLNEVVLALAGTITIRDRKVYLVNVHLTASPLMPEGEAGFRDLVLSRGTMDVAGFNQAMEAWKRRNERRITEVKKLLVKLRDLSSDIPCIVAGDFNAEPDSQEMKDLELQGGFVDTLGKDDSSSPQFTNATWDVDLNQNTAFSSSIWDAMGNARQGYHFLSALAGARNRRLDYIFLGSGFSGADVLSVGVVLKESVGGLQPSDHFGVFARIDIR